MQAIKTVYLGPTNNRGSRIKATCEGGSVTVPYPHEKSQGADAHSVAALALMVKLGWTGRLAAGGLKDCYVFVFCGDGEYVSPVTPEEAAQKLDEKLRARGLLR